MKTILASLIIISSLAIASCQTDAKSSHPDSSRAVDNLPGACPYLTKDNKGNAVLSWIRNTSDSTSVFCYAVSADGGKTFGPATVIPSSNNVHEHSENMPKIIFKPSGEIIALWGAANPNAKNKYSGLVYYTQSFDEGRNWTAPAPLVKDTAGYDQRYFDVALLASGEAAVVWLDNRKTSAKEGSALYFASTNGRNGFGNEQRIQQQCCQCCRTDLFVDSKSNIHVLYRAVINDSIRDMVHTVSTDGGQSFTHPQRISNDNWVISGCPHTGPAMTENKEGLHFAWYTGGTPKGSFYTRSSDNGKSFVAHDSVSARGSHPQLATLSNGELLIAWDETIPQSGKLYSRIGIQKRTAEGKSFEKQYIAEDSQRLTYPVISETKGGKALIAYCQEINGKNHVRYQLLEQ
jgi:hypothetical protein